MMTFSIRTLAFAWTGLAGAAAIGVAGLQASYHAPAPPVAAVAAPLVPEPVAATAPPAPPVPFENRSLLAMLPPPDIRPHPVSAPHPAAPLPVPPVPPSRMARAEPHHAGPVRVYAASPAYPAEPAYPDWGWRGRMPYPGQFAMQRSYPYAPSLITAGSPTSRPADDRLPLVTAGGLGHPRRKTRWGTRMRRHGLILALGLAAAAPAQARLTRLEVIRTEPAFGAGRSGPPAPTSTSQPSPMASSTLATR